MKENEAIIDTQYQNCTTVQDTALIVREFLQDPTAVGAIAPSSQQLAKAVVAPIPAHGDPVVVELGAPAAHSRQSRCGTGGSDHQWAALGRYAWVRVSAPARRFRRALGTRFEEVIAGRTILRNVPPAFVYYARRPLPH